MLGSRHRCLVKWIDTVAYCKVQYAFAHGHSNHCQTTNLLLFSQCCECGLTCMPGEYKDSAVDSCRYCKPGRYAVGSDAAACTACPLGKFQFKRKQSG